MGIINLPKGLQSNHQNSVIENFACNPHMQIHNSNFNTHMQIKYNGDFLYDVNLINNNVHQNHTIVIHFYARISSNSMGNAQKIFHGIHPKLYVYLAGNKIVQQNN